MQEVQRALQQKRPVVALESTIISHGMPYPQNLQTALEVEQVVRQHGAVPATIAIIAGQPCIGCTADQLEHIAKKGPAVRKVSRRDIPLVVGAGWDGATTVSGTMLLAARAGIRVFVTGGIGGVHRDGHISMDVSADLTELGRTPVTVVCAGAKSVLDIPRTLEFLETQGVCVAAYQCDEFPAFFTRHSGCKAPCRVDTPEQVAGMIRASSELQLGTGLLLAVPIPEAAAAEGALIQQAIEESLAEADKRGICGAEVTPFLLESIRSKTGGASLVANIQLVKNNAAVGSQNVRLLADCLYNHNDLGDDCIPAYCQPSITVHGDGVWLPRAPFSGAYWVISIHKELFTEYTNWHFRFLELAATAGAARGFSEVLGFFYWEANNTGSYRGLSPTNQVSHDYGIMQITTDRSTKLTDVTIWRAGFAEEREVLDITEQPFWVPSQSLQLKMVTHAHALIEVLNKGEKFIDTLDDIAVDGVILIDGMVIWGPVKSVGLTHLKLWLAGWLQKYTDVNAAITSSTATPLSNKGFITHILVYRYHVICLSVQVLLAM
eukprot:gene8089-8282_t